MNTMTAYDTQLSNEYRFSRKFIDQYIRQEIADHPETEQRVHHGAALLQDWLSQDYFESKNQRLAQLATFDLEELVRVIFVQVAYCQIAELFTSVSAQLAGRLKFSEKAEGIQTAAELLAVLCQTDAFDIIKEDVQASLMIQSAIPLSERLLTYISQSRYLPPMVCEPDTLTHNYQSGYLTHNDCLILGGGNGHDGDICLDVLNTQNRVALRLDTELLSTLEENATFDIDTAEKDVQWRDFKATSYELYSLLARQGNCLWLTHKVDKRGRIYAQGYHITTQGSSFKKASLELHRQEVVGDVPAL
ncbi:hypothetical protein [Larsenimonas suaedae]|uniref:Uncharacterized protein n=1 Tax=Larsenimonas suaedae TaxID=1851019 RepID=A0ABU1GYZ4_9GAMM|nr:hypothetical protein [Larsenimonas suaedae]MCM2973745.1 hypothetical protein [Larsenimonas suaedae]MDR5897269.1 hypothetical protein [Larsenimonas suaedae]